MTSDLNSLCVYISSKELKYFLFYYFVSPVFIEIDLQPTFVMKWLPSYRMDGETGVQIQNEAAFHNALKLLGKVWIQLLCL